MEGVQRFLAARDVASVDHPSLAFPNGARQFLVYTKIEGTMGNKVWHHDDPWRRHGVDGGKRNLWGGDGDERHVSGVDDCCRVKKGDECFVLRAAPKVVEVIYPFLKVSVVLQPGNIG